MNSSSKITHIYRLIKGKRKLRYKVINNIHSKYKPLELFDTYTKTDGTLLPIADWILLQIHTGGHLKNYHFQYAGYVIYYTEKDGTIKGTVRLIQ